MGDYLPISMFFYEIWVKNRPFSCFDKTFSLFCIAFLATLELIECKLKCKELVNNNYSSKIKKYEIDRQEHNAY